MENELKHMKSLREKNQIQSKVVQKFQDDVILGGKQKEGRKTDDGIKQEIENMW